MSEKDKLLVSEIKKEEPQEDCGEAFNKRTLANENEHSRKQESRMMNFFNQEFFERKIDFKPK